MYWLHQISDKIIPASITQFMADGGPVLWWLAALLALFWLFALERLLFLLLAFPKRQAGLQKLWSERKDRLSWYARKQRDAWLAEAHSELFQNTNFMKLIITLFPMLGLSGTVIGMISVFDVLALEGNADPKSMASGISLATLPTMAGMVAALVGVFTYSRLISAIESREVHLERLLRSEQ